jgi:hypothetical protein
MTHGKSNIEDMRPSHDRERTPLSGVSAGEASRPHSASRRGIAPRIERDERKESPPAPLLDGAASLRLDQAGQLVERARHRLIAAGACCLVGSPMLAFVISLINGDGEHSEDLTPLLGTACMGIAGGLLLLGGFLIGRLTADWWHPRLTEQVSGDSQPVGLSFGRPRGRSASGPGRELDGERRYGMAKRVRHQLREAQIYERRLDGGGTLLTEPILVLHGRRREAHAIFDQEGNPLGSAVRVTDPTAERRGNDRICEVRDNEGQSVLAIRLAARRRWLKRLPTKTGTYAICSPAGAEIATVGRSGTVTAGDEPVAHLDEGDRMVISDADGREIAHVIATAERSYVVRYTAPLDEPLRRVVLATAIVWDDTRTDNSG